MEPSEPFPPPRRALGKLRTGPPQAVATASTPKKRSAALVQPPLELPSVKRTSSNHPSTSTSSTAVPSSSTSSSADLVSHSFTTAGPQNSGQEKMREVTKEFFLENKLCARDIAKLSRGGVNSGADDVGDLAKAGAKGRQPQNAARDLTQTCLHSSGTRYRSGMLMLISQNK